MPYFCIVCQKEVMHPIHLVIFSRFPDDFDWCDGFHGELLASSPPPETDWDWILQNEPDETTLTLF